VRPPCRTGGEGQAHQRKRPAAKPPVHANRGAIRAVFMTVFRGTFPQAAEGGRGKATMKKVL